MYTEVNFNKVLSMTRVVVENAYGRLKGRFRRIAKKLDLNVETGCLVIAACCVLHNIMSSGCKVCSSILVFSQSTQTKDNRNAVAIREAIKTSLL